MRVNTASLLSNLNLEEMVHSPRALRQSATLIFEVLHAPMREKPNATGYIDKQLKMVFSLPFDSATPFVNGIARVRVDVKSGYIDKTGKYI